MVSPDLALILLSTIPSGDLEIMTAREGISELMFGPGWSKPSLSSPILSTTTSSMPMPTDAVYIGFALKDDEMRMTRWSNPFDHRLRSVRPVQQPSPELRLVRPVQQPSPVGGLTMVIATRCTTGPPR